MKKHVFLSAIIAFLTYLSGNAQTEKRNLLLGGSGNFSLTSYGTNDYLSLDLSPTVGFFIADNVAIGSSFGYSYAKNQAISGETDVISLSLFGRYYFKKPTEQLRFFFNLGSGFSISRDSDKEFRTYYFIMPSAGLAYFLNEHIAFETTLNYQKYFGDFTAKSLFLNLGFQIHFRAKKRN